MKNSIIKLVLFSFFVVFSSCSKTNVIENRPDDSSSAPAISGYFKKRVLIEDYTGTWCGNCTRVSHAIDEVEKLTDKAVTVAIHNGNDPFSFVGIEPLKNLILPNSPLALPVSRLNRTQVWTFPEPTNIQEAISLTSNNTSVGLAMRSTVTNQNIDLEVNMKFVDNYSGLKLVVYLLESKLIYFQRNYTDYYNAVNPILNYEHNHVLRNSITNILGDEITGTSKGSTFTKNFSIALPSNIARSENISFVAFLVGSDNKVINVRESKANEVQEFEQNQ